ncbi:MAG: hypothetical protein K2G99_02675, partial [Desulfovibrio sp.]|nr:hypothetical protein [Desulfovibrio sp.]
PGSCGQAREQDGEWRAAALAGRQPGHSLELAEAYPLIESILLAEKKSAAFGQWLEESLGRSEILVAPELRESLLTPGLPGYVADEPDEGDELERPEAPEEREEAVAAAPEPAREAPPARRGAPRRHAPAR